MATSNSDKSGRPERRLSYAEHLDELRACILWALLSVVACFALCLGVQRTILGIVMHPHMVTMASLGLPPQIKVIRYQEGFLTLLKVCAIGAIVLASPFVVYQVWRFVSEGLRDNERRYCLVFGPVSFGCFALGVLFGYFLLIPFGLRFLLVVLGPEVRPDITLAEYVSLVALLTLVLGLLFELPLVMLFLTKLGVVAPGTYAKHRKPALLVAFIAGAVLTPPDPFTQIMMAVPIVGLYEVGILASQPTKRNLLGFAKLVGFVLVLAAGLVAWGYFAGSGTVVTVRGDVYTSSFVSSEPCKAVSGSKLCSGAIVRTAAGSRAELRLSGGATLKLNASTAVQLSSRRQVRLFHGEVLVRPERGEDEFLVRTPNGDVSARGGEVDIQASAASTSVIAVQGSAEIVHQGTRKRVLAGHLDRITTGGQKVDVTRAIAWTRDWGMGP